MRSPPMHAPQSLILITNLCYQSSTLHCIMDFGMSSQAITEHPLGQSLRMTNKWKPLDLRIF
jgi:hypothetical protein